QAEQDPAVERARLNTKPRGFIHFFNHTPNQTARPLHTKMRRAINLVGELPAYVGKIMTTMRVPKDPNVRKIRPICVA
ncbi:hypothetical protein, partial [Bifidobacterium samirii]|uniref:hypothetical protein n=1 Tax=Bifidobacterium samirii TaxID=2306974 RepID=UPI0019CF604F